MSGDFSPEARASGWWSTDSRKAVSGRLYEVWATKTGRHQPEDISHLEPVQMGLTMQPVIARLFQDRMGVELRDADYELSHPSEPWMKSHFDYIGNEQGKPVLVECKNYNLQAQSKFSEPDEPPMVPPADWYQCCHEAAVHQVETVYLAVLFGGQFFRTFRLAFTDGDRDRMRQAAATWWAYVSTDTAPEPETIEQAKKAYPLAEGSTLIATQAMETLAAQLRHLKEQISAWEKDEAEIKLKLQKAMASASELRTIDGRQLITWKNDKLSKRFDPELFRQAHPSLYEQFVVEKPGPRKFLVK